jgi:hypothetical protein
MEAQSDRFGPSCHPRYSRAMPFRPPTLLQMSAAQRLALAAGACAVVWAVVWLAL